MSKKEALAAAIQGMIDWPLKFDCTSCWHTEQLGEGRDTDLRHCEPANSSSNCHVQENKW